MSTPKFEKRQLASLVIDMTKYPRVSVDRTHIGYIADALQAGVSMPPIIIEDSGRVVDGVHRWHAYKKVGGSDSGSELIDVEIRTYKSDSDMYRDAIRLNTQHGRNLSPWDRQHAIILAEKYGISAEDLAADLASTVSRVLHLRTNMARKYAPVSPTSSSTEESIPLKRLISHKRGQMLTKQQEEAQAHYIGLTQVALIQHLISLCENTLLDLQNPKVCEGLRHLRALLAAIPEIDEKGEDAA